MNRLSEIQQEEQELLQQEQNKDDLDFLMDNPQFRRAILDGYIRKTCIDVGGSFGNSDSEVDALKAVSHLRLHLESNQ